MGNAAVNPDAVPVLQDIVEIRIGREGQQVVVPLDLAELAERIAADLVPHVRRQLQQQLDACVSQTLDATMGPIQNEVQRVLLEQLGNPDN